MLQYFSSPCSLILRHTERKPIEQLIATVAHLGPKLKRKLDGLGISVILAKCHGGRSCGSGRVAQIKV